MDDDIWDEITGEVQFSESLFMGLVAGEVQFSESLFMDLVDTSDEIDLSSLEDLYNG